MTRDNPTQSTANGGSSGRTRRQILQWASTAGLVSTAGCGGGGAGSPEAADTSTPTETTSPIPRPSATPTPVELDEQDFATNVRYWAWFPSDENLWSRSESPYDFRTDNRRWLAWPTEEGGVRCRVEGDAPPGNAGFYIPLGAIGDLGSITIESETVRSDRDGAQQLLVALYLDVTEDGEFFEWEAHENRESFAAFGGDLEAIGMVPAGETITLDEETALDPRPTDEPAPVRLAQLKAGDVDGVSAATDAALQVSVVGSGEHNVEEAVINSVRIETEPLLSETDWPTFAYDHLNVGTNPSTSGPTGSVEPRWTFKTDGPVRTAPAVADGTVYVGSDDGSLYALDAETGEEEWVFETDAPVRSSPAAFGYMVFVGSHDYNLYGIDTSGERQWTFETEGRVLAAPKVQASPTKRVPDVVVIGSEDGNIYIIDPWTGELLNSVSTGSPIVVAPMLYTQSGGFWEVTGGNVSGNEFGFFHYNSDFRTNYRWAPIRASISAPHRPYRDIWYIANDDGRLDRWDFQGPWPDPAWTFRADDKIRSSPTLVDDHVVVGSWDGSLYGLIAESGELDWTLDTDAKIDSTPAGANGSVFVGSTDGVVYGVNTETGDIRWRYEDIGPVRSSPAVVDQTVYVGSDDGYVNAIIDQ